MMNYTEKQFTFVRLFEEMQESIHETSKEKGFYETPPSDLERICLMHEEFGGATEAVRKLEMPPDEHCPMFSRLEIKMADVIIRIMDYAQYRNLRVVQAILAKIEANKARPYKHGKKL
jgi:NTP pyrophosphatase (non-canonical NTP hydrolase)